MIKDFNEVKFYLKRFNDFSDFSKDFMDAMKSFIESDTVENKHDSGVLSCYHIPIYELEMGIYGDDGDHDNK